MPQRELLLLAEMIDAAEQAQHLVAGHDVVSGLNLTAVTTRHPGRR